MATGPGLGEVGQVRGHAEGLDTAVRQFLLQAVQFDAVPGHQRDPIALRAESAGRGQTEGRAGTEHSQRAGHGLSSRNQLT
jgi:hypothetical protein